MPDDSRPRLRATERLGQQNRDLEWLRHHWGSAYDIAAEGDHWSAARLDGTGTPLAARSAAELRALIVENYTTRPVPRPSLRASDDE